ncbi:Acg family FMN-binding oxidoreductase [Prauserella endophytica]|uniref:Nitroreductase n=1 Tax=Prauserella endophytica TaxID=1592324 RepID=A0ABY2S900_9PSEU|nr:nitroreductase family protein [Prauserella endophytica]TKG72153.1 nitroreductase [Prauserella endophytica]
MSTTVPASPTTPGVEAALAAAVRAPSPHNTQPWRFRVHAGRIDVWLDPGRVLPVCDPDAREAVLACGAAILNMRLSIADAGRTPLVELLPDREQPLLLATIRPGRVRRPGPEDTRLAAAIPRRHTNRRPFLDRRVPLHLRHALRRAAVAEGARLVLLDQPGQLEAFAALLRRSDHLQSEDPAFRAELAAWTRDGAAVDGVPRTAGGPRALDGGVLALRDYGERDSAVERRFERDPLVAVLQAPGDTRLARLRAGQAMQRVLLTATAHGLSASFLAQPVEVPAGRAVLKAMLGEHEHPQAVLRLGYGFPGAATPRRPVHAVVEALPQR